MPRNGAATVKMELCSLSRLHTHSEHVILHKSEKVAKLEQHSRAERAWGESPYLPAASLMSLDT